MRVVFEKILCFHLNIRPIYKEDMDPILIIAQKKGGLKSILQSPLKFV